MATIIKAKKDKDGRVVVRLFRNDYDVTDKLVNGIATLELYGGLYEIHAEQPAAKKEAPKGKKVAVKKAKDNSGEVSVGFIESPDEA